MKNIVLLVFILNFKIKNRLTFKYNLIIIKLLNPIKIVRYGNKNNKTTWSRNPVFLHWPTRIVEKIRTGTVTGRVWSAGSYGVCWWGIQKSLRGFQKWFQRRKESFEWVDYHFFGQGKCLYLVASERGIKEISNA